MVKTEQKLQQDLDTKGVIMLYIFRCMMTTHVVVQDDEPYIGTGDRPLCDYCYDIAEEGSS